MGKKNKGKKNRRKDNKNSGGGKGGGAKPAEAVKKGPSNPEVLFGLDVGTGTAKIALFQKGADSAEVLANATGIRATQMVLSVSKDAGDVTLGDEAVKNSYRSYKTTVFAPLRLLTVPFDDPVKRKRCSLPGGPKIGNHNKECAFEMLLDDGTKKVMTVEEAGTSILGKLKTVASNNAPNAPHGCCLVIPCDVSPDYVKKLALLVTNAGFNVRGVIRESAAAALAYKLDQITPSAGNTEAPRLVLTFNFGHSTARASLLKITDGLISRHSSNSDDIGTLAIEELILKHMAKAFKRKTQIDILDPDEPNYKAHRKLMNQCHKAITVLSRMPAAMVDVESLADGIPFNEKLSKARFEMMINPVLRKALDVCLSLVKAAGFQPDAIQEILATGAGCAIPKVQAQLKANFPSANLRVNIEPQFAPVLGAALQCQYMRPADRPSLEAVKISKDDLQKKIAERATMNGSAVNGTAH